jgi:hypothetical protein
MLLGPGVRWFVSRICRWFLLVIVSFSSRGLHGRLRCGGRERSGATADVVRDGRLKAVEKSQLV